MTAIMGIALWALLVHIVYAVRNRYRWARRTVDWMSWSSRDERAVLGVAVLADAVIIVLLVVHLLRSNLN